MDFYDFYDEIAQHYVEVQEREAFQRLKDEEKIQPVVLIANPIFMPLISEVRLKGVNVAVLWSSYSDKDKMYQVTDPELRKAILENIGRQSWQEKQTRHRPRKDGEDSTTNMETRPARQGVRSGNTPSAKPKSGKRKENT